ncbi:unnamed protein product [Sphenostylis stenocarpa]|uniref:Secreted protein n=1 Tax=Sphenostylis stenocarpa TaxID=92480 RepID=A0AA86SU98_9FABA|nr:unnamed protein product [Sphenostylis stenocarpa]
MVHRARLLLAVFLSKWTVMPSLQDHMDHKNNERAGFELDSLFHSRCSTTIELSPVYATVFVSSLFSVRTLTGV